MYRTRTAAMGSMGLSLLILSALTASYLFAQVKPFDYRGDTARVQGGIALTLKAGKYEISRTSYQILGKVQRGEFVKMEGFDLTIHLFPTRFTMWSCRRISIGRR